MTPLAILWLIIIVPVYVFAGLIGSVPSLGSGESFWQYAMSTGLIVTGAVVAAGVFLYVVIRAYNIRRGIDVDLISKTIPPE